MELLTSRLVDDTLHWSKVNMYKHVMSVCTYYPRWKNAQHTGLVVISVRMKSMNKNVEVLWNLPNLPAKNGGSGVPLPVVVQRPSTTFPLIASNDEVVNKELAALWSVNGWNLDHEGCRSNNWDLNFRLGEFYRWKSVLYGWTAQDRFCSVCLGRKNLAIWSRTWLRGRYICIHHCVSCEVLIRDKPFGPFLWRRPVWLVTGDGISKITPLQPTQNKTGNVSLIRI